MNGPRALTDADKDAILAAIGAAWKAQPGQRLGQLLVNECQRAWGGAMPGSFAASNAILDRLFFIEDGDLAHLLSRRGGQK